MRNTGSCVRDGFAGAEDRIFLPCQRQQYDSITGGQLLVRLSDLLEGAPEAVYGRLLTSAG